MQNDMGEVLYNSKKAGIFFGRNYEFVKKHAHILHKPRFTMKKSKSAIQGLTYRQVNDWDSKDLISSTRKTKNTGWRRFSTVDLTKLYIISDLRKIGLNTKRIRTIINRISASSVFLANMKTRKGKSFEFLELEHAIMACASEVKMLLLVRENEQVYFLEEDKAVFFHFQAENASFPTIILPFFSYLQKIFKVLKRDIDTSKNSTVAQLFDGMPSEKEKKILDIIRKDAYQKITLEKGNGEVINVETTEKTIGRFTDEDIVEALKGGEYGSVKVVTKQGQKVQIIREDRQRI